MLIKFFPSEESVLMLSKLAASAPMANKARREDLNIMVNLFDEGRKMEGRNEWLSCNK